MSRESDFGNKEIGMRTEAERRRGPEEGEWLQLDMKRWLRFWWPLKTVGVRQVAAGGAEWTAGGGVRDLGGAPPLTCCEVPPQLHSWSVASVPRGAGGQQQRMLCQRSSSWPRNSHGVSRESNLMLQTLQ